MRANGLQLIRLHGDQVVLRRGVTEVLLTAPGIEATVEALLSLLDGSRELEQVVEAFPGPARPQIERLLRMLVDRRLIGDALPPIEGDGYSLESSFYANFGLPRKAALERLQSATVIVYGANLITQSLVTSLLDVGVGTVTLARYPLLTNEFVDLGWLDDLEDRYRRSRRITVTDGDVRQETFQSATLLCATSDLGEPEGFYDLNRQALSAGKLFLPAWVAYLVGYIGPLVYPFETACFRCYRLRADASDPRHDIAREIRKHITTDPAARASSGLLPPMARVVGEIAAMEVVKSLTQFAPSDVVARLIEINLASFASTVRRVLKIPRCPDCSDVMQRAGVVTAQGPQIPFRE